MGYSEVRQTSDKSILEYPNFYPFQGRCHLVNQRPTGLSPWIQQTQRQREMRTAWEMINHDKG